MVAHTWVDEDASATFVVRLAEPRAAHIAGAEADELTSRLGESDQAVLTVGVEYQAVAEEQR